MLKNHYLIPEWPAPKSVFAYTTTRHNGHSTGVYASNNLAQHVADHETHVTKNRQQLISDLRLPQEPRWLNQTHSAVNIKAELATPEAMADASYTQQPSIVCSVLTADCLPILICNKAGNEVAAIHAGWRGLASGIIQNTLKELQSKPDDLLAWLGPAIGPDAFEIGDEVRDIFIRQHSLMQSAFKPSSKDRWLADIYQLATIILHETGVTAIYSAPLCTYSNPELFYSYRRDGQTGRMASLIWFE